MKIGIHVRIGLSFEVMLLFTIKKPVNIISPVDYPQENN